MSGGELVDLRARRLVAALDELAELALGGVNVWPILAESKGGNVMEAISMRIHTDDLARLDRLAEALADSREARLVGVRWGRASVLRIALERGLEALEAEHAAALAAVPAARGGA